LKINDKTRLAAIAASVAMLILCGWAPARAQQLTNATGDLDRGFRQMYNLDFLAAHDTFHRYQHANPSDPMGYVADSAAYLFSEFERLHVLESDLFVDDSHFDSRQKLTPDAAVKAEFDQHLAEAEKLADQALVTNARDTNALFAKVMANGLRSDYAALIEKRNLASLGYIKTSRALAQQLLAIDPTRYDAYLSLGAENYLLGVKSAPVRWVLAMTGAQTDKQQGIEQLRIVAEKGRYLAPFARLLLAVAALRDKDTHTAKTLLAGLATEFPDNKLYSKELSRIQ
jgi:hypothetical protein